MTVTKTTMNLPWTVCPGAPGFSPAAQNWSEKNKVQKTQSIHFMVTMALSM